MGCGRKKMKRSRHHSYPSKANVTLVLNCTQNIFQLRVMLLSARVLKIAIHQFRSSKVYHGYFIFPIYL